MAKANITQYDSTPSNNSDINSINIAESCPASNINNAIRELMAHLKDMDTGTTALTSPSFTAMSTDTISEKTSANGVAIDSVTLKDGELGTTSSPVPINSSSLNGGQFGGRRNLFYNGNCLVAQRAISATGVGATTGVYPTLDRFRINTGVTAGRATMTQESITDLAGFSKAMKLACTTADTSIASGEAFLVTQTLEGYDVQGFEKGFSSAKEVTLSFYVKGNASATYTAELFDRDNTRFNGQTFSVTTNWTRVTLTFAGDTTGKFDCDANASLDINFWLHAGSDLTGGTFSSNTWHTTSANRVSSSSTSFFDSTSRTFFITGIQLEIGSATPFEHRSLGEQLQLCKRYFCKESGSTMRNFTGGTIAVSIPHFFKTNMRTAPTITGTNADALENINANCFGSYKGGIGSGAGWQLTGINADAEL